LKTLADYDILNATENDTTARGGVSMADEEHVRILKQGVEVWNKWRDENPIKHLNFHRADLTLADLRGVNLSMANLFEAELSGADLSEADLSGADLTSADLNSANLSAANLAWADLSWADLSGADLSTANLGWANLLGANLFEVDLRSAEAKYTIFADVDLRVVKGLDIIKHVAPSTIGIDTIYRSKGKIPEAFLRGCGVHDDFITYMGSLTGKAFEYYSCFISYSNKDDDFAQRLHNDLQGSGVRCWFAPEDMKIGDEIRPRIDQSIRLHDKLLVILSEHSIDSDWVEDEVETAIEEERKRKETVLFPIRLDESVMDTGEAWAAKIRRTRHIGDFCQWKDHDAYQGAFDRLLRDLKAED
jgi:hypothetical protein